MTRNEEIKMISEQTICTVRGSIYSVLYLLMTIGGIGFLTGLLTDHAVFVWRSLLINTLFFGGISIGGLILSAIFTLTNAAWARPIKRIAESFALFLPMAGVLFLLLLFGADTLFEWVHPKMLIESKQQWLNFPFFIKRNLLLFMLFLFVVRKYMYATIRPDLGLAGKLTGFTSSISKRVLKNYTSQEEEQIESLQNSKFWAAIVLVLSVPLTTLIAFDWIMSLDQHWHSSLFGVEYLASTLLSATAALTIGAGIIRKRYQLEEYITIKRYRDISRLLFAGCMLWTYMVYSQVLVIYYGNLPAETGYLMLRMSDPEWSWLFRSVFVLLFVIPFFGLISRTACGSVPFSSFIALLVLIGCWLEKFILVVPSMQENRIVTGEIAGVHINFFDLSITLGIYGLFLFCQFRFLEKVPIVPISDQRFFKGD